MTDTTSTFQNKKAVNNRIKRMRISNLIARNILFLFAIITILTTIGIIVSLL